MADQVREQRAKFEAWFEANREKHGMGHAEHGDAAWAAWKASASLRKAEVRHLKSQIHELNKRMERRIIRRNDPPISAEELRALLSYDAETGQFTWKVQAGTRRLPGEPAGVLYRGYVRIKIHSRQYFAHRLAWLYVHGVWPVHHIDHINGVPNDNRITNLRDVEPIVNAQNSPRVRSNNKLGILGVHLQGGKYIAQIKRDGKRIHLGSFGTAEEAVAAHEAARLARGERCVPQVIPQGA